jgi:hypothetical protein
MRRALAALAFILACGGTAVAQNPSALAAPVAAPVTATPAPAAAPAAGPSDAESSVGYIDSALPVSQLRLRYDAAFGTNVPSRAEFFYPQSGFPGARGPQLPERNVNYQELSTYLEWAYQGTFSTFVEVPVRWVNPDFNPNEGGLGDVNAGFKWAFYASPCLITTFQLRAYFPSATADSLGTGHYSIEPSLLFNYRACEWLTFEGEFRYWIPIGGTDFAGDVTRYGIGAGLGHTLPDDFWAIPVVEFVGWTVLGGKESVFVSPDESLIRGASGDTIVNVKAGLRFGFADFFDIYLGYGRALTGDVWYKDIARAEMRIRF